MKSEADVKTSEELEEIIDIIQLNEDEYEPQSIAEVQEITTNDADFNNYLETLVSLIDFYGEEFVSETEPYFSKMDIKGMEKVANKYLKLFYNAEIAKVKHPDSNKKAFKALQDWLKGEVFGKKKVTNLYSNNNPNINSKFLMYKMKYRIESPVDFETEMGDYLENPRD